MMAVPSHYNSCKQYQANIARSTRPNEQHLLICALCRQLFAEFRVVVAAVSKRQIVEKWDKKRAPCGALITRKASVEMPSSSSATGRTPAAADGASAATDGAAAAANGASATAHGATAAANGASTTAYRTTAAADRASATPDGATACAGRSRERACRCYERKSSSDSRCDNSSAHRKTRPDFLFQSFHGLSPCGCRN